MPVDSSIRRVKLGFRKTPTGLRTRSAGILGGAPKHESNRAHVPVALYIRGAQGFQRYPARALETRIPGGYRRGFQGDSAGIPEAENGDSGGIPGDSGPVSGDSGFKALFAA